MTTNLIPWQMATLWMRNGKFTWPTSRGYQKDYWWYPANCWACTLENIFNLLDILNKRCEYYTHVKLCYRCVKNWMVKIWQIFGQSSILPNFCGTKVSLHTVYALYCNWPWPHYVTQKIHIIYFPQISSGINLWWYY